MSFFPQSLRACILSALLAAAGPTMVADASAGSLDLVYGVASGGRDLGRIEVQIDRDASPNRVEAVTRPQGVAKLFADVVTERFTFMPVDGGWQARDYSERGGDENDDISMTFDYGDTLLAHGAGADTTHPTDSLVEPQGFPLSALLLPGDELATREILMPSERGLRSYRYVKQGEERVKIGSAGFDTVKWLRQRPDRNDRGFHVWLDKASGVPVRIEKFKEGDIMVMELKPETLKAGS